MNNHFMKTAEELFKELGFIRYDAENASVIDCFFEGKDFCYYRPIPIYNSKNGKARTHPEYYQMIMFVYKKEWDIDNYYNCQETRGDDYCGTIEEITPALHRAITQQLKELNWL